MTNLTETPRKVSLPPLHKILGSPAEYSLRHSLIQSTPLSNIFNPNTSNARNVSLPSIDTFSSPILKKSTSFNSNHLPIPLPTISTPITQYSFNNNQSTPIKSFTVPQLPTLSHLPLATPIKYVKSSSSSTPIKSSPSSSFTSTKTSMVKLTNKTQSDFKTPKKSTTSPIPTPAAKQAQNSTTSNNKRKASFDDSKCFAFISHSQETFLLNEPDIDNARLARRKRRRTSPLELEILKNEFKKGSTPNKQRRILIAKLVDMTEKAVQIWFQNKRQSIRKCQMKNSTSKQFIINNCDDENIDDENIDDSSDGHADESNDFNITPHNIFLNNKENLNPNELPPKGIFTSPKSSSPQHTSATKKPLADITNKYNNNNDNNNDNNNNSNANNGNNQHVNINAQTFKFKSTNFGLIKHETYKLNFSSDRKTGLVDINHVNENLSRRQKPIMKLKIKNFN